MSRFHSNMCSWKSVIKHCFSDMQELLNLNCLASTLYAKGLLTDQELQEITNEHAVPSRQNSHFTRNILPYKGERSFETFLEVLENDKQHSGHKELFAKLIKCYKGARAHSSTGEIDSDHTYVTKRQLKLIFGELMDMVRDTICDQLKEVIAQQKKHEELQKFHEEQEQNRHQAMMKLINNLVNQQHSNGGLDPDVPQDSQRRISAISIASSVVTGGGYSADYEESETLSVHSSLEDMKPFGSIPCSPDDEHSVSDTHQCRTYA